MSTFQKDKNIIKEVLVEKGLEQAWLVEQLGKYCNMANGYVQADCGGDLKCFLKLPNF